MCNKGRFAMEGALPPPEDKDDVVAPEPDGSGSELAMLGVGTTARRGGGGGGPARAGGTTLHHTSMLTETTRPTPLETSR